MKAVLSFRRDVPMFGVVSTQLCAGFKLMICSSVYLFLAKSVHRQALDAIFRYGSFKFIMVIVAAFPTEKGKYKNLCDLL